MIGNKIYGLSVSTDQKENSMVRSALERKLLSSDSNADFTVGAINMTLTNAMQKLGKFQHAVAIPIYWGETSYGAMYITGVEQIDYSSELPILEQICLRIGEILSTTQA